MSSSTYGPRRLCCYRETLLWKSEVVSFGRNDRSYQIVLLCGLDFCSSAATDFVQAAVHVEIRLLRSREPKDRRSIRSGSRARSSGPSTAHRNCADETGDDTSRFSRIQRIRNRHSFRRRVSSQSARFRKNNDDSRANVGRDLDCSAMRPGKLRVIRRRHPSARRTAILASCSDIVYLARSERTDMNEMPNSSSFLAVTQKHNRISDRLAAKSRSNRVD